MCINYSIVSVHVCENRVLKFPAKCSKVTWFVWKAPVPCDSFDQSKHLFSKKHLCTHWTQNVGRETVLRSLSNMPKKETKKEKVGYPPSPVLKPWKHVFIAHLTAKFTSFLWQFGTIYFTAYVNDDFEALTTTFAFIFQTVTKTTGSAKSTGKESVENAENEVRKASETKTTAPISEQDGSHRQGYQTWRRSCCVCQQPLSCATCIFT